MISYMESNIKTSIYLWFKLINAELFDVKILMKISMLTLLILEMLFFNKDN
jgi:hypothetical protein